MSWHAGESTQSDASRSRGLSVSLASASDSAVPTPPRRNSNSQLGSFERNKVELLNRARSAPSSRREMADVESISSQLVEAATCQPGASQLSAEATMGEWRQSRQRMRSYSSAAEGSPPGRSQFEAGYPRTCAGRVSRLLQRLSPDLHEFLAPRVSSGYGLYLGLSFAFVSGLRYVLMQQVGSGRVASGKYNPVSVMVLSNVIALASSVSVSLLVEGRRAASKFRWHMFWRFCGIAALFTVATSCRYSANFLGASEAAVVTIGYIYMPISALLSIPIMLRKYGILEWLSLGILTLAVIAFIDLRAEGVHGFDVLDSLTFAAIVMIAISASASALGSIFAERIFKDRSRRLSQGGVLAYPFYIYKAHIDFAALPFSMLLWMRPKWVVKEMPWLGPYHDTWIGEWGWWELLFILIFVAQGWLSGLVTKHFSTVSKSIIDTVTTVLAIIIVDPLLGDRRFQSGTIPCALLTAITVISALVFQTGRLNIRSLLDAMHLRQSEEVTPPPLPWRLRLRALCGAACQQTTTYGSVLVFVLSDAARTLTQQQALSKSMITPQSMVLASYACGVVVATILTIVHGTGSGGDRLAALRQAYNPCRILAYLPCAFFFALASTLLSMGYAEGISAALSTALGYVYMPISALASRFFLGKFYMWLEWCGLIILTLAAAVFGFLQSNSGSSGSAGEGSSPLAMSLIILSATASVFASLAAERVLKKESLPFHVQKVRLDLGSVLATLALMPVIGLVSSRPQDAFWKQRPLHQDCADDRCWASSNGNTTCGIGCTCDCGAGMFVAWGDWSVLLALFVNVAQGWLNGVVIKQFSTVLRAIAQASTILVIYFIGDPLVNPSEEKSTSLTLVAFIVPLSTTIFMVAVSEMEKVMSMAANCSTVSEEDGCSRATSNDHAPLAEEAAPIGGS